jgi:uncharacterized protein YfaS (alpha-2-macroglobulin family)
MGLSAVSQAGQLGSATLPLLVKQDFFVEATIPPELTQGDEVAVPVTVHTFGDKDQTVTVELAGDGLSPVGPAKAVLHLSPREAGGVRFSVRAEKAGEGVVRVMASSATRTDVEERKVSIIPNGLKVVRTLNGRFTGSTRAVAELPGTGIVGGNDLVLKLYGGPLSQIGEGLEGVFQMPHGCFEQTSSTTYPSVLALAFLRRTRAVSPEIEKKARGYILGGYQRLVSFEVPGGGFSLFGKEPASTTLTAYGLLELSEMSAVSPVDEVLLARARNWLYSKLSATGGWSKSDAQDGEDDGVLTAYVAWALARADSGSPDPRLAKVLDTMAKVPEPGAEDAYALALRANALLAGQRSDVARPILERLAAAAIHGDSGTHWTSAAAGVLYSHGASLEVEVTGLAAHALAVAGMYPDLCAGALDWIVAARNARGTWSTTQATVSAMRALLDAANPTPQEPQDIRVEADGALRQTFTLTVSDRDVHRLVSLRDLATTGRHAVELHSTGAADVSYQLVVTHYLPWQALPGPRGASRSDGSTVGAPLNLDVTFTPSSVPVPVGATVVCHVRLAWRGSEPARMPLVEVGVPAGFEVEEEDLDAVVRRREATVQWFTVEARKVTLYLPALRQGHPLDVDFHLRALRSAHVLAPSSAAYLYYEPEVRSETAPVRFEAY